MFDATPTQSAASVSNLKMQQEYAAQAQAQSYAGQNPAPLKGSDAEIQRIAHQIDMLYSNSNRLSSVTDRLVGSRPKDVGAGAVAPSPGHMPLSAKLSVIADTLSRLNAETSESIERLENFI